MTPPGTEINCDAVRGEVTDLVVSGAREGVSTDPAAMLHVHQLMAKAVSLLDRELDRAVNAGREGNFPSTKAAEAWRNLLFDSDADVFRVQPELQEHLRRDPLLVANHPKQEMFGTDVVMMQPPRLLARVQASYSRAG